MNYQPTYLREAPKPCDHSWLDHMAWTFPVGLSLAAGLYGLTFGSSHVGTATSVGFLVAAWWIWFGFHRVADCARRR